jgi:hypothetical protein
MAGYRWQEVSPVNDEDYFDVKIFFTVVLAVLWIDGMKSCVSHEAHGYSGGISDSAARMAKALEEISATLAKR